MTPHWRDDVLLDLRAADGEWVRLSEHCNPHVAQVWSLRFRQWCVATKWQAFTFRTVGCVCWGRFIGTRMERTTKVKTGKTWTASMMARRG